MGPGQPWLHMLYCLDMLAFVVETQMLSPTQWNRKYFYFLEKAKYLQNFIFYICFPFYKIHIAHLIDSFSILAESEVYIYLISFS